MNWHRIKYSRLGQRCWLIKYYLFRDLRCWWSGHDIDFDVPADRYEPACSRCGESGYGAIVYEKASQRLARWIVGLLRQFGRCPYCGCWLRCDYSIDDHLPF